MTTITTDIAVPRDRARAKGAWLFSARVDLLVFGGSFVFSMLLLGLGAMLGMLHEDLPIWGFLPAIVFCDVAHVWATTFRTYLDPEERRARPWLLTIAPIAAFLIGVVLFARGGALVFWRTLAYVAIFHFVRQQYGWVSLYRARASDTSRLGKGIDTCAIYVSTLYPLLYWHTHARHFSWFVTGDVVRIPIAIDGVARALYVVALGAYAARSIYEAVAHRRTNFGKDLVVATTAIAWFVGIVLFDSDYAFTVTNVFIHGVPYFALVYTHARARHAKSDAPKTSFAQRLLAKPWTYVGALWIVAFAEEMMWDRGVWHEHASLFGEPWSLDHLQMFVVPLLAVPQIIHYVLDGFVWRRRSNASVRAFVDAA